jgi:hypothetical protein
LLEDLEIFFEFAAAKPPTDSYLSIPRSTYAKSDAENEKSDYDNGDSANSSGSESDGNESDDDSEDETEETESESKTSDSNSRKKSNDSDKPERFGSLSLNIEKINSTSRASLKSLNNTASSDQTLNASKPSLRGSRINVKNSTSSKISVSSKLVEPKKSVGTKMEPKKSIDQKRPPEPKKSVESRKSVGSKNPTEPKKSTDSTRSAEKIRNTLNTSETSLKSTKLSPKTSFDLSKKAPLVPQNTVDETTLKSIKVSPKNSFDLSQKVPLVPQTVDEPIKSEDHKIEASRTFIVNSKKSLDDLKRTYSGSKKSTVEPVEVELVDTLKSTDHLIIDKIEDSIQDTEDTVRSILPPIDPLVTIKRPGSDTRSLDSAGKRGTFLESLDKSIEEFEKSLKTFEKGLDDSTDSENVTENDFSERTDTLCSFGLSDIMEYSESSDSTPSQDPTLLEASEAF